MAHDQNRGIGKTAAPHSSQYGASTEHQQSYKRGARLLPDLARTGDVGHEQNDIRRCQKQGICLQRAAKLRIRGSCHQSCRR